MKRILLVTNIYPIPNVKMVGMTAVCHYFAKEWIKLGYEVVVMYNYVVYTPLLHKVAKHYEKKLASIFPTIINTQRYESTIEYEIDGVKVILIPCYKFIPKLKFPNTSVDNSVRCLIQYLTFKNFKPDVIAGHFLFPSLQIILQLRHYYKCPVALTLHGKITPHDGKIIKQYEAFIDMWGFRSVPIQLAFTKVIPNIKHSFLCFSGIPTQRIVPLSHEKHNHKGVKDFLFVGNLIKRKFPVIVAQALLKTEVRGNINYIGDGDEENKLRNFPSSSKTTITLLGRLSRDRVFEYMQKAECFIMISKDETFGLVYLEALSNGCIVIASRDEGMEGIIKDGENGFLCEAGNEKELASIISHINLLSPKEKIAISKNAIKTAQELTDKKVADNYLKELIKLKNNTKK